jgi:hypothetical protein
MHDYFFSASCHAHSISTLFAKIYSYNFSSSQLLLSIVLAHLHPDQSWCFLPVATHWHLSSLYSYFESTFLLIVCNPVNTLCVYNTFLPMQEMLLCYLEASRYTYVYWYCHPTSIGFLIFRNLWWPRFCISLIVIQHILASVMCIKPL